MEFTMIHDVYCVDQEEVEGEDGKMHEVDVEKLIEEDTETRIYIELADIRVILPYYTNKGVHIKERSILKANGDNYVVKGTFEELMALKKKTKIIKGFGNKKKS